MKTTRVIGWYGRGNSGDEAFKDVHRLVLPNVPLSWIHDKGKTVYLPKAELRDDLVLMSAGDLLYPFYLKHIPPNAQIIVYGVGVAWESQMELLVPLKSRILAIWVRNTTDVAPLRAAGFNVFYTPDIVFNLAPLVDKMPPRERTSGRKQAVVIVSDNPRAEALRAGDLTRFLRFQNYLIELAAMVDFVSHSYDITFVPFSFDDNDFDLAAIYDVLPRVKERDNVRVNRDEMNPIDMIRYLRQSDLIISMKFHGVVYALLHEIPFVAMGDTRKLKLICEENNLPELWQPMSGFSAGQFKTRLSIAESEKTLNQIRKSRASLTSLASEEAERFASLFAQAAAA